MPQNSERAGEYSNSKEHAASNGFIYWFVHYTTFAAVLDIRQGRADRPPTTDTVYKSPEYFLGTDSLPTLFAAVLLLYAPTITPEQLQAAVTARFPENTISGPELIGAAHKLVAIDPQKKALSKFPFWFGEKELTASQLHTIDQQTEGWLKLPGFSIELTAEEIQLLTTLKEAPQDGWVELATDEVELYTKLITKCSATAQEQNILFSEYFLFEQKIDPETQGVSIRFNQNAVARKYGHSATL
ncbi:hypothetical protein KA082_02640 [Candidatus Woesebacteria bacterium]|nr:hypothetical protein [Candidatus Woesebacteria bacterium]